MKTTAITPAGRKTNKWKHITQDEFDTIKLLISAGLKLDMVASVQDRSYSTIVTINNSNTLEEYKQRVRAYTASKKNGNKPRTVASEASDNDTLQQSVVDSFIDELNAPAKQPETLERIAVALERLADAWERTPEKKSTFFGK